MAILRLPEVMRLMGYRAHASIYNAINDGIFTKPVAIGERAVGWPDEEVCGGIKAHRLKISSLHAKSFKKAGQG